MASLTPKFGSRTKVLKAKTSDLKLTSAIVKETIYRDFNEITFLSISEPDLSTLETINRKYKFHHLAIEDCLSEFQRSKIEPYKDYIHVILQVPTYDRDIVIPAEVNFFISESYLVLVHWNSLEYLKTFIDSVVSNEEIRKDSMAKGTGYLLYKILDMIVLNCFSLIDNIEKRVRILESKVFDENIYDDRKTVREIAKTRRDIMAFHRIIKPQIAVMNSLERIKEKYIIHDMELYFGDIADHVTKQWEMINDQHELIINLSSTNESLISVRANNIMKTLTIMSVIILPLTLISGIYGMNIRLPIAEFKFAFEIIIACMLLISVLMMVFFKRKKWI